MHIVRRIMGSIGCFALGGVGIAVAMGVLTPEDLAESSERRGKAGGIASMLGWLLDSIGTVPAGLLVLAIAVGILFALWLPYIKAKQ